MRCLAKAPVNRAMFLRVIRGPGWPARRTAGLLRRAVALGAILAAVGGWPAVPAVAAGRVTCYTSFDSDYFYLAASIQKPTLKGTNTAPFGDPLTDDAVAVFLQAEDTPTTTHRSPRSVEMVVSVAGGAQLYRGADAVPLKGFDDFLKNKDGEPVPFRYGITRSTQIGGPSSVEGGYIVELAIPWLEIGGAPAVGQRMRFNVVALSSTPDTAPIMSLAKGVKTMADLQNPSLWSEIVFVDAPVRIVASAPNARVCARVFTAKPLMDGILSPDEWSSVTSFSFAESGGAETAPAGVAAAEARIKPQVTLTKPEPCIVPAARALAPPKPHAPQPVPHLTFALYQYDYQADSRKKAPLCPVAKPDGTSLLVDHPLDGCGPWMSYDDVDWHYLQAQEARQAGIDVLLPVYGGSVHERQRYGERGLNALVAALRALAASGQDHPLLAMYLDTAALSDTPDKPVDASTPDGRIRLYAAIRDFFLQVPRRFRATVPLTTANGGGLADIVVLSSAHGLTGMDPAVVEFLRSKFREDFGEDLIVAGAPDFGPAANLDAYVPDTGGRSCIVDTDGWIKTVSLGVGAAAPPNAVNGPVLRADGRYYRENWQKALGSGADWAFIDEWNDYRRGIEIAPSEEYGVQYVDMTRASTVAFGGGQPLRASLLAHTVPTTAVVGGTWMVSVRLANAGAQAWTPDRYALSYRWAKDASGDFSDAHVVPLARPILPGQAATPVFPLRIPTQPGSWVVRLDLAEVDAKGNITAYFGARGGRPMDAPVRVVAADDKSAPAYGISLVTSDLATTLQAGGTYSARVTVRNDGREPWHAGTGLIAAHLWRAVSAINMTGEQDSMIPVEMTGAAAVVPEDVAPGQIATVTVPVTFCAPDGSPLPAWSADYNWTYLLRWECHPAAGSTEGATSAPEALALVASDFGAVIGASACPPSMPAEHRIPVLLSVRNAGPETWRKDLTRVGYHWYYQDGTECVWQDETTPIPQDLPPGGSIRSLLTWITAPPYDGSYWLVWDVKVGDTWDSTQPGARVSEAPARRVQVVDGKLSFVDLSTFFNADGVASDRNPADGSFDAIGTTLPAELVPPLTSSDVAAVNLWHAATGVGLDSSRRYAFRWGPKDEGQKNMIECRGQKLILATDPKHGIPCRTLHMLAAATTDNVTPAFTLQFADGSQQYSSFPIGKWDAAPESGDAIGYSVPYTRSRSGRVLLDRPAYLYHYSISAGDLRKLMWIQLPNAPEVKVLALTAER